MLKILYMKSKKKPGTGGGDQIRHTHMDDFKITGKLDDINWFRDILKAAFGEGVKLTLEKQFIHTGIRHSLTELHDYAALDQNEYAQSLKPLTHHTLARLKDDEFLDKTLHAYFLTLLGAVAWL